MEWGRGEGRWEGCGDPVWAGRGKERVFLFFLFFSFFLSGKKGLAVPCGLRAGGVKKGGGGKVKSKGYR